MPYRHVESGGIAPRILNLGTRWRWVVSFTPHSPYPPGERVPGTHFLWGCVCPSAGLDTAVVNRKKSHSLPGIESRPSRQ